MSCMGAHSKMKMITDLVMMQPILMLLGMTSMSSQIPWMNMRMLIISKMWLYKRIETHALVLILRWNSSPKTLGIICLIHHRLCKGKYKVKRLGSSQWKGWYLWLNWRCDMCWLGTQCERIMLQNWAFRLREAYGELRGWFLSMVSPCDLSQGRQCLEDRKMQGPPHVRQNSKCSWWSDDWFGVPSICTSVLYTRRPCV